MSVLFVAKWSLIILASGLSATRVDFERASLPDTPRVGHDALICVCVLFVGLGRPLYAIPPVVLGFYCSLDKRFVTMTCELSKAV
jgi:hypothetical protein